MLIDPISTTAGLTGSASILRTSDTASGAAAGHAFKALITDGVTQLDTQLQQANQAVDQLALGGNVSVQDVMIAMEKARLSLDFAVQVRNRIVDAYQEFMRMQV